MDEWRWTRSKVGSIHSSPWLSSCSRSCFWPRLLLSRITGTTTATPTKSPRRRARPVRTPIAKREQPMTRVKQTATLPRRDRRATDPMTRPSNDRPGGIAGARTRRDESQPAPRNNYPHPPVGTFRDATVRMARIRDTVPTQMDPTTRTTTRVTGPRHSTAVGAGMVQAGRVPGVSVTPTTSSPRVRLRTLRITTTATSVMGTMGSRRRTRPTPAAGSRRLRLRAMRTTTWRTGSSRAFTRNRRATRTTIPPTGSSRAGPRSHRSRPSLRCRRTDKIGCSPSPRSFRGPRMSSCRKDLPVYCHVRAQVRSCSSRLVSG